MEKKILELKLKSLKINADEIHVILPSVTRIFSLLTSEIIFEIDSNSSKLDVEFYFRNKSLLKAFLSLTGPSAEAYSKEKVLMAEFSITWLSSINTSKCNKCEKISEATKVSNTFPVVPYKAKPNFSEKTNLSYFFDEKFSNPVVYIKYLENIITGIDQKVLITKIKTFKEASLEKIFELAQKIPENSKKSYQEILIKLNQKMSEKDKTIQSLKLEKEIALKKYENDQKSLVQKKRNEEKLSNELASLKSELTKLKSESRNFEGMSRTMKEMQSEHNFKDETIFRLKSELQAQTESVQKLAETFEKANEGLLAENNSQRERIKSLDFELKNLKSKFEELTLELFNIKSQTKTEQVSAYFIEKVGNELRSETNSDLIRSLNQEISALKVKISELLSVFKKEKEEFIKRARNQLSEIDSLKKKIAAMEASAAEKTISCNKIESPLKNQYLLLRNNFADMQKQFEYIKGKNVYHYTGIYENSEILSTRHAEVAKDLLICQRTVSKLVEVIRENYAENMGLREKLFLAQMSLPLYIPVKGDPVDFAMAEYVNSLKNPLKVPFVREEHGIYLFGSRNIRIRLQNSKLIVFFTESSTSIEEFVAKNTKIELEKLEMSKKRAEVMNLSVITKKSGATSIEESPNFPYSPVLNMTSGSISVMNKSSRNNSFEFPLKTTEASFGSTVVSPKRPLKKNFSSLDTSSKLLKPKKK